MGVTLIKQMAAGEAPPPMEISVEQYHEMIRRGILPECAPIELIDGLLVWKDRSAQGADPMSHDPRHALAISRFQRLEASVLPHGCFLRIQLPVTLSDTSEPEPDIAVVKGSPEDYANHHPGPADLMAAIEVAISSLQFDRTTKQQKYASASIRQLRGASYRGGPVCSANRLSGGPNHPTGVRCCPCHRG